MHLISLGISHRNAEIGVRERFALTPQRLPDALRALGDDPRVSELVILSTCNRTELIARADSAEPLMDWFRSRHDDSATPDFLQERHGADTVMHLFRIASGLESLVLGEPEILGQTKQAWKVAADQGTLGPLTSQLFEAAFAAAKRVRNETAIGRNPVSVPTVTARLAQQIFGNLKHQQVLFVGAGDMVHACMQHFSALKPERMHIANRNLEKARALAQQYDAEPLNLDGLSTVLPQADVVISCTAASNVLIDGSMVRSALKLRKHRPVFIVDLAVPRDVDPAVGEFSDIYLYSIDDLQRVASGNLGEREQAAEQADELLAREVENFLRNWRIHEAGQFIHQYRSSAERLADRARQEALAELEAGVDAPKVIARLSHKLAQQLLHQPSRNLRRIAAEGDDDLLKGLTDMFRIDEP